VRNDFERDPGVLLVKHKTAPTIPQKGSTGASARVVKTLFVCVKGLLLFPCRRFPPSGHVFVLQLRRRGVILGPGRPHRQPQKLQKSSTEFLWLHLAHTPWPAPLASLAQLPLPQISPTTAIWGLALVSQNKILDRLFVPTGWLMSQEKKVVSRPLWCIPDFGVYPPANATLVYSPLSMEGVHRFETKLPLSQQLVVYTKVRYTPESGSKAFTIHQSEGIHQKHVRTNALFVYTKVRYTPDSDRKQIWTHTLLSRRAGSLVLVWPWLAGQQEGPQQLRGPGQFKGICTHWVGVELKSSLPTAA